MTTAYNAQPYSIPPTNQMTFYGTGHEPSPASSASPTSPRINEYPQFYNPNPARQLRPLKSPLYVPAVLRPTEHFPTPSPMTPPKSLHGSLDNLQNERPQLSQSDLDVYLEEALAQEDDLGDVTGPPTKDHWKPDEASPNCDSPQCKSNFNLFVRKHHCRHCGHIFCSTHSSQSIPLDQSAKFHPEGIQSRACETCYRQFQRWDTARSVRRKNSDNSDESGSQTPVPSLKPGHRRMISNMSRGGDQQNQQQQQSMASSVPRDWAWSTF